MQVINKVASPLNTILDAVIEPRDANFWLQKINPLWSVNQALGKLVRKEQIAQEMMSLIFAVNSKFQMGQAGQHHPIWVEVDGVRLERSYSLTKVDAKHVRLTVKLVEGGKVSQQLQNSQIGQIFEFGQPYGDMYLENNLQAVLMLAAGSGITPMYSLICHAVETGQLLKQAIELWYWVKTPQDAAFVVEFERIAQQYPNFSLKLWQTQAEPFDARFNADYLNGRDLSQTTVFACGPAGFAAAVEQSCTQAKQLKTEAFSLDFAQRDTTGEVTVTLAKSGKTLRIAKGQSILTSLEQQQIKPQHGCRMGICNKCVCQKVEGSTQNLVNGQQNTEPGTLLKICVNSAQSDLVLDL